VGARAVGGWLGACLTDAPATRSKRGEFGLPDRRPPREHRSLEVGQILLRLGPLRARRRCGADANRPGRHEDGTRTAPGRHQDGTRTAPGRLERRSHDERSRGAWASSRGRVLRPYGGEAASLAGLSIPSTPCARTSLRLGECRRPDPRRGTNKEPICDRVLVRLAADVRLGSPCDSPVAPWTCGTGPGSRLLGASEPRASDPGDR
jgi:hypothetical protein